MCSGGYAKAFTGNRETASYVHMSVALYSGACVYIQYRVRLFRGTYVVGSLLYLFRGGRLYQESSFMNVIKENYISPALVFSLLPLAVSLKHVDKRRTAASIEENLPSSSGSFRYGLA